MHRLIARILLLTALLGTLAPVALAIGAPAPHACCLRRLHRAAKGPVFESTGQASPGNCCPPRTPNLWAAPAAAGDLGHSPFVATSQPWVNIQQPTLDHVSRKSVRAPPVFSIA